MSNNLHIYKYPYKLAVVYLPRSNRVFTLIFFHRFSYYCFIILSLLILLLLRRFICTFSKMRKPKRKIKTERRK